MISVTEKKRLNEIYYTVIIKEGKKEISTLDIELPQSLVSIHGFDYLSIYNKDMVLYEPDFSFLNYHIATQSINSRLKARQALKLLHCFELLINNTVENFSLSDANNLIRFLNGVSYCGEDYSFNLITTRSNKTINEYLSVYRSYLSYIGSEPNHPLLITKTSTTHFFHNSIGIKNARTKYNTIAKTTNPNAEFPLYISPEDFNRIISVIRCEYSIREECIVRLMFENGFRIGEVLGITNDDLVEETYFDSEKGTTQYANFIYLRNRVSDRKDQKAKTCMTVQSKEQYDTKDYKTEGYGYQRVPISSELYNLLIDYIEDAHTSARNKDNYSACAADRVRRSEPYEDENFYLFLNARGSRLSQQSWNTVLKEIFRKCGLPIDTVTKKNNLNHRFRHGFAMFNIEYRGFGMIELRDALRHKSAASVVRYFRPTVSDKIKLKTEFTKNLYDLVPALKDDKDEDK